ncbi:enoyl-CoA hydratase/isomerase family protein [Algivirga pacifica]|uniref:Enoyl-CoA hydratase-related protein n=1 Tax=Algivirga pacifica TaxID=1162670 RepID=A0ABP9DBT2_9BACT
MDFQNLLLDQNGGVLTITINREEKLNALNAKTIGELEEAIQIAYDKDEIRAVIVTGKGQKAFVAGADISEIAELDELNARKFSERGQEVFAKFEHCPKPVIAAVNGYALGGGCELAMACHMRVASNNAMFGLPEVSLGIIPAYGGTQRLPQLVGKGVAYEMITTGDMISAEKAERVGLANYNVPQEELLKKCHDLIDKITKKGPLAVAHAIDCIHYSLTSSDGYNMEANAFSSCCKTGDFKEGTAAFLEKRKPNFVGQ